MNLSKVARIWWPLAASWLLMGAELPALSAVIARLPNPAINLAAYGGIVFPIALIIESPIIMLLAASTALSKDMASYRKIWRFMMIAGASLTALHALIVFTPLYYVVRRGILGAPAAIVEPARIGLTIMLPWTWTIAYRRFNQGVMIRFGHSRSVGAGTVVRLSAGMSVLLIGLAIGTIQGIVVATAAVAVGVTSEAIFAGRVVRPVLRNELALASPVEPPLTYRVFFAFYIPLVLTALLSLLAQPIGSAALGRMPQPVSSLAVWRSRDRAGIHGAAAWASRSTKWWSRCSKNPAPGPSCAGSPASSIAGTTAALLLIAATPLSRFWFQGVSALPPELAALARTGLWIALPLPALSVLQSWYQGQILHSRRTRSITEAVVIFLVVDVAILVAGVSWGGAIGLYVGLVAMVASMAAQTAWLGVRSPRSRPGDGLPIGRDAV